jgi:hypothetical protein
MRRKIPTFSKFALSIILAIFALSIIYFNGEDAFLKPNITEAANSQASIGFTNENPQIRAAIEVQNKYNRRLRDIPGVVGFGTGIAANGKPVIRVFTRRAGIPAIPENLDGITVHVKVTGEFIALSDPAARFDRPVPIGVSTGHPDITAGTLGARVKDEVGNVFALSNNHVYANINRASIGDNALQPGPYDGGSYPGDEIGILHDFEWIDFSLWGSNTMDAAIVSTTSDMVGNATLPEGYGTPNSIIFGDSDRDGYFDNENQLLNLAVQKFGRTTGLTHGQVTEINVTSMVCYANCSNPYFAEYAWFDDQISISGINAEAFSLGGDSGSLVVTDDDNKYPVGLLFAGSSTTTLANRIDFVLKRFNVSIDDSEPTVPSNEVCDNGIDDDGDSLIDCDDSDCSSVDSDDDGTPDCTDGCPNDPEKIAPGVCGCGVSDTDSDNDGTPDCNDDCPNDPLDNCTVNPCVNCWKETCDGICNPKKDGPDCPDCIGTTERDCNDSIDNDGDGDTDCDDSDCLEDPACPGSGCLQKGEVCSTDADCCDKKCAGRICR